MKTINVLNYGKFEETTAISLFNLPFLEFRGAARCLRSLFNEHSEAYAIMIRVTADGMPVLFWSNSMTSKTFFTPITPEIDAQLIRQIPDSYRQGGFTEV